MTALRSYVGRRVSVRRDTGRIRRSSYQRQLSPQRHNCSLFVDVRRHMGSVTFSGGSGGSENPNKASVIPVGSSTDPVLCYIFYDTPIGPYFSESSSVMGRTGPNGPRTRTTRSGTSLDRGASSYTSPSWARTATSSSDTEVDLHPFFCHR